ncbi:leucine-rich repeat-containing G-protein coupled receptor 5-like isoform X1 [Stegostoma tigrinum]|uniref:leucine-rich repeat-containing G-protein coupled receptor 5-like isoform X1 n=1 Tax=Stegostoma tigrinum TaxID=3053191 RepID=UPI00202B2BD2|nr:leucine-rich repeat-containing G-protein coupled receptor 5-like isoform X1 [Stegostoma tigrinum]
MKGLLLRLSLLLLLLSLGFPSGGQPRNSGCPSRCHCEEDGILLRVDCSDLDLDSIPANLSTFTSYLDLSMNNITELSRNGLFNLHFLEELRLAGNDLTHIPLGAFAGLYNLKVLMLQNNRLGAVPEEALQNLQSLQSLRLDANHISVVPSNCFKGLVSLRHLWLDDNALTDIPVKALSSLPCLQAMTLALNRIPHISDYAFQNLSSLVVLHLHNNQIHSLGKRCFDGLHSLETLDLNYNNLDEFPVAIKTLTNLKELGFHSNNIRSIPEHAFVGNPSLLTIHFYDNPIQFVGKSAFQHLPELRILSLNGATEITEFPDLTGTISLESLTLTGAQITSLPSTVCKQLPNLQVLDLSYNWIQELPSFFGCQKLQKLDLHHNKIYEIQHNTFRQLTALRSLDLGWNKIEFIHQESFISSPSLIKLDLTFNLLSSLPVSGLSGLTHLKITGNQALQDLLPIESLRNLRVLEMPYAYQCCSYGSCENSYKLTNQWEKVENSSEEEAHKQDAGMLSGQDDQDPDDLLTDFEEVPKIHHSIQCAPTPGPFKPCDHLFGSWMIRLGVWCIVLLSLVCNGLVATTVFGSPAFIAPPKLLIGLMSLVNALIGGYSGILAIVDLWTLGRFAKYGAWWENGVGCQVAGFLAVFASEMSIFLLTVAAVERSLCAKCDIKPGKSLASVKIAATFSAILASVIAMLPLFNIGDYGISPLCFPLPFGEPSTLGFLVALVLLNSLCFLVMTITYTKLYCRLEKGDLHSLWDCSMVKHVAWLLFTNCILYCPVAFLSFSSLLNLTVISPDVIKSILLVILPLPGCLNPLIYILFNPHFKDDLGFLRKHGQLWRKSKQRSLASIISEDAEKQSCDSTQELVTCPGSRNVTCCDSVNNTFKPLTYQMMET